MAHATEVDELAKLRMNGYQHKPQGMVWDLEMSMSASCEVLEKSRWH